MSDTLEINGQTIVKPQGFDALPVPQQQAWIDDVSQDLAKKAQAQRQAKTLKTMPQIEAFGRYLEGQDIKRNMVDGNNAFEDFMLSAGMQLGKTGIGIKNLLGIGDSKYDERMGRSLEQLNNALENQSPVANFGGRVAGGTVAALPLAMSVEAAPALAGMGWLGRTLTSMGLGSAEGLLEMPFSNETRASNTVYGGLGGAVGEQLSGLLQQGLKRIPFGVLANSREQVEKTVREAVEELGLDYDALKPETKEILKNISGAEEIDNAVRNAMETEFGFALTKGEASQDFAQIAAERGASRMSDEAGDVMRDFKDQQNTDITNAAGALADDAGGKIDDYEQMGVVLKEALEDAKSVDRSNYKELYEQARILAKENNIDIPLSAESIQDVFYRLARDHMNTDGNMLKDIGNKLAQYGILDPKQFKADTPILIPDVELQRLGVSNSEDFIKYLNSLYSSDPRANMILGKLKEAIETNADEALAKALSEGGADKTAKQFLDAARQAREANKAYRDLWEAKDILQDITGVKPNTKTPLKDASEVVALIRRKPENARRVIEELINRGNTAAVEDLRTFLLKDLFEVSLNPNVPSGSGKGLFSGAKLTTAINKNDAILKEVLTPDQYSQLKAFEVEVGKATKVPEGAVNYSNSGYKVVEFLMRMLRVTPILNPLANMQEYSAERVVRDAVSSGREPIDYVMKLDANHTKLNTLIRQVLDKSVFEQDSALAE